MQEKKIINITVGDIATNCWIYPLSGSDKGTACAIIDPGAEADRIISVLKQHDYVPRYILLTHGHFDHIAALPELIAACRNNSDVCPEIAIHSQDSQYLGPASYNVHRTSFSAAAGNTRYIDRYWNDMPSPDLLPEEGDTIGPFTVLHLPGHTEGSIALWDREAENLFSGDTLFMDGYGRTDLPGGNEGEIIKSLNRLFAMDSSIKVFPGHGPATTIGAEAKRNMV